MATCYRHPSRETNVSCSNCGRPICPDCMTSTPVGMRCPECSRQRTKVKNPVGAATRADAPVTYALIGICVAVYVAQLAAGGSTGLSGGGKLVRDYGLFGPAVADGEPYRLVTSAFLHAGLLHLGFNMFVLYFLGVLLEPAIGSVRFAAIYAVALLSGSFAVMLLDPNDLTVGASGGVFGLMAAAFLIARNRGLDQLASQLGFLVVFNLLITFTVSNISIGAHAGGLIGGGLAALLITAVERRPTTNGKAIELAAMAMMCVLAVAGALIAADANSTNLLG
jgi:membrane associated rhomboid family serine protease